MHEELLSPVNPASLTAGRTLDHAAAVYDVLAPVMTLGLEGRYRREAIRLMDLHGGERVLDVGCGTGTLTRQVTQYLASTGNPGSVVGLDAASRMIEVARRKAGDLPHVTFDAAIAEDLPYPNAAFDRAVSTFFFHHVNYMLKVRSLNEIWRVLRPGGTAVIVDVDTPTTLFGALCAWSGFILFQQDEIRENIKGRLRDALKQSRFGRWEAISHHSGYITIFKLWKETKEDRL